MRALYLVASLALIVGCGSSDGAPNRSAGGSGVPSDWAESASASSGSDAGVLAAGELTAGVLDDNWNFESFEAFTAARSLFTDSERLAAYEASLLEPSARAGLDVALVLDTTGSMGDEISYLQAELAGIATNLAASAPGASLRFALVAYRDFGDEYVTHVVDFTSDVGEFASSVSALSAGGGGDFPEAVPEALAAANGLAWSADAAIGRVALWVADAPAHDDVEAAAMNEARIARDAAIRYYPIAASGVDPTAELEMRSVAQLTRGRYIFLTDDSGIGSGHAEPTADCYYVTRLRDAMARVLRLELEGAYAPPAAAEIVRTVGGPVDGMCSSDGGTKRAF